MVTKEDKNHPGTLNKKDFYGMFCVVRKRRFRTLQRGVGLKNVLIVGLVRSLLSMLFLSVRHMIPRNKIF